MTQKSKNDLAAGLVFFSFLSHIFGYFFWQEIKIVNIFYVTIYFNMFVHGFVFMMLMNGQVWRVVSTLMFWVGSQLLYMELWRNPMDWTNTDVWVLIFTGINAVLISFLMDKLKHRKQNG